MPLCVRTESWIGPPQGKWAPRVGVHGGRMGVNTGLSLLTTLLAPPLLDLPPGKVLVWEV